MNIFPFLKMTTLRNDRKLASINKDNQKEKARNNQAQDTNVATNREEIITPVSEEIESRMTKKLSQDFSRTDSRLLGTVQIR